MFLNLCDGTPDDPIGAVELAEFLEESGVAFRGADAAFIDPSRAAMRAAGAGAGVPYPAGSSPIRWKTPFAPRPACVSP